VDQPVEALQLVFPHQTPLDHAGLDVDPMSHHGRVLVLKQIGVLLLLGVLRSMSPRLLPSPVSSFSQIFFDLVQCVGSDRCGCPKISSVAGSRVGLCCSGGQMVLTDRSNPSEP
jgi:hypothetical protein